MEAFSIKGDNGNLLTIGFVEVYGFPFSTCHWGGYEVKAQVEIKSNGFCVTSTLWTSTGEVHDFLTKLEPCHRELNGEARFSNYEGNLDVAVQFTPFGSVAVKGRFYELGLGENELSFLIGSDQSYLNSTIKELQYIALKYGGKQGIKSLL